MHRAFAALLALLLLGVCACAPEPDELVEFTEKADRGLRVAMWEDRVYVPFAVVSKSDCGRLVGHFEGDPEDKLSAYKDYPVEEWLVSWMRWDGGAMLLKEESVTEIPEGLVQEYDYD